MDTTISKMLEARNTTARRDTIMYEAMGPLPTYLATGVEGPPRKGGFEHCQLRGEGQSQQGNRAPKGPEAES